MSDTNTYIKPEAKGHMSDVQAVAYVNQPIHIPQGVVTAYFYDGIEFEPAPEPDTIWNRALVLAIGFFVFLFIGHKLLR